VTVAVMADEQSDEEICAGLRRCRDVRVVSGPDSMTAEMLLTVARVVGAELVTKLNAMTSAAINSRQRVVLVTESLPESYIPELISCGVISIMPLVRATPEHVAEVLIESRNGVAVLPNEITRWLVDNTREYQARILERAKRRTDLFSPREIEVLGLLAEGYGTVEIAGRLNYSDRTIKKVISSILTRFDLRNRAHAVSFAIREGII
jgi:DNA-binding NarL/FixJ family response regulator